ncbi:hypothetical protein [Actinomadura luteofluorescens]|uniref:hypothetical protein n=1 Tax=Actinomadura luteofluorescens TaxID=46163 RepID=UPI0030CBCD9D
MDEVARAIANLALDESPADNVASIKNAVISNFLSSDENVSVESTDYFNHTYAPDLILRWKRDKAVRHVFLRTINDPRYLSEDVAVVAQSQPIIMPLVPLSTGQNSTDLQAELARTRTLVATPSTIDTFNRARQRTAVAGLLSRAVFQGGRGLVDSERAASASDVVDDGLRAAQVANVPSTRRAIDLVEEILDLKHAGQINRLLQAVWLGSGAAASNFPGASEIMSGLDSEGLQLLLDLAVSDDPEFWRRIGAGLTFERLCEIDVGAGSNGLQHLVNGNLDHLRARACKALDGFVDDSPFEVPRWSTASGMLQLHSTGFRAFFLPGSISDANLPESFEAAPVSLSDLLNRAEYADIQLSEVRIELDDGSRIDYRAPASGDISRGRIIRDLGRMLGRDSRMLNAVVALGFGSRQINCDLVNRVATGRTVAKFKLSELLTDAIPVIADLPPRVRRFINAVTD